MNPKLDAEKELRNETKYQDRVKALLNKHRGVLQDHRSVLEKQDVDDKDLSHIKKQYAAESSIIERVMANERTAFFSGIALSGLVFTTVRFGPRFLAVKINPEKAQKLKEADEIAEKAGTRWIQKAAAFAFEASFGAWAGWRGYSMISSQNKSSYEEISKIPLCAGRSNVCDNVCEDWVKLVHEEIPAPFWRNLEDEQEGDNQYYCKLKDPQRWRAVRDFADNCVKRMVYEDSYRKQHGMKADAPVVVPAGGVPEDILTKSR